MPSAFFASTGVSRRLNWLNRSSFCANCNGTSIFSMTYWALEKSFGGTSGSTIRLNGDTRLMNVKSSISASL